MKKLLCMVLALIMLISVMALSASAETVYSQGDVNMDGIEVGGEDLVSLRKQLMDYEPETDMSDVNEDDEIDIRDLVRLKKIIADYFDGEIITQGTNTFDFS